ncbi:MAG TPA: hypothetical protein VEY06_07395 [Flavisolibacter sp.]|nr:hypothetical protein [Flavisolibacter sp.]
MLHLFFLVSLLTHKPNYCSCSPLPPIDEQQYKEYNLIVKGRIANISLSSFERTVDLSVGTYYKGRQNKGNIKIKTPRQEGICGIVPKVGEEWLMFAYADKNGFRTERCTRTKSMNLKAWDHNKNEIIDDIKFLEAKLKTSSR